MTAARSGIPGNAEAARSRRDLYRFLAGLFLAPPEAPALEELRRGGTLDGLAEVYGEEAVSALRDLPGDAGAARLEFDRLFLVPARGFVPPYESVHRGRRPGGKGGGHLYGRSCLAVAELMKEAGARLPEGLAEPPDHVGVELLFLSFLCEREGEAWSEGDRDRLERWLGREELFLREHLAAWFDTFAEKVAASAPGGFYAAVCGLARRTLAAELAYLSGA